MSIFRLFNEFWESGTDSHHDFFLRNRSSSQMAIKWSELQLPQAFDDGLFVQEEWLGCVLKNGDTSVLGKEPIRWLDWIQSGWMIQHMICQCSETLEFLTALNLDLGSEPEAIGCFDHITVPARWWHPDDFLAFHNKMTGLCQKQAYIVSQLLSTQLPQVHIREDRYGLHMHSMTGVQSFRIVRQDNDKPLLDRPVESGWVLDVALGFSLDGNFYGARYTCMDQRAWLCMNQEPYFEEVHYRPLLLAACMPMGLNQMRCRQLVQSHRVDPVFKEEMRNPL